MLVFIYLGIIKSVIWPIILPNNEFARHYVQVKASADVKTSTSLEENGGGGGALGGIRL